MKYTKQDLLGAVIKWSREYLVIPYNGDLAIKCISPGNYFGEIYSRYTLEYLNTCSFTIARKPNLYYEIY